MRRFHRNDERGATAVLIAICSVGLIIFAGLVLDGGNAYAQRRQMQNAADSSSLAGVNALYKYKTVAGTQANTVYLAALDKATDNGAKVSTFVCKLVLYTADVESGTTDCPTATGATILPNAWKVRVTLDSDHGTQFMSIVGINSFTARGNAAASLLAGTIGNSPFVICTTRRIWTPPEVPILLLDPLDPTGWSINPAAIWTPANNVTYDIWGNDLKNGKDCNLQGQDFRGLTDNGKKNEDVIATYTIPGEWPVLSGNKAGRQVPSALIGGCIADNDDSKIKDIPDGTPPPSCTFAIPLCDYKVGNDALHCVKIGVFETVDSPGTTSLRAKFLGGGLVTGGAAGGIPEQGEVMVIKLSE